MSFQLNVFFVVQRSSSRSTGASARHRRKTNLSRLEEVLVGLNSSWDATSVVYFKNLSCIP